MLETRVLFSAAILIGGKATRFDGRDKSALLVHGRTIQERHRADACMPGCGRPRGIHATLSAANSATTAEGDADIVVPRTERGYHPLCAVYSRAWLEPAAGRLARGELELASLFDDVRVRVVSADAIDAN